MKEYALFLDKRLIGCSTAKASIWELLVRLVRELQANKILPKRQVASPIDFARAQGVKLSIHWRSVGAPSHSWTEIPGWSRPPKKPRGNSARCAMVLLTTPAWLRAWISSTARKQPESQFWEEPLQQSARSMSLQRQPPLLEEKAPGMCLDPAAAKSPCNEIQQPMSDKNARCIGQQLQLRAGQTFAENPRQKASIAPNPEAVKCKQRRLRSWLFSARCRLNLTEYSEFRKALQRLHGGRSTRDPGELCSLVKLLWRADFPEGTRTHVAWIMGFEESLPRAVRRVWHNTVLQFAPEPVSLPEHAGEGGKPAVDPTPNSVGQHDERGHTERSESQDAPIVGERQEISHDCQEHGWLISRSAAFLNRKRRAETDADGTLLQQRRRDML